MGGREGERVREHQREEEQGREARWRARETARAGRIQRKKRGRGHREGENELQGLFLQKITEG